jgi:hypothetical protein
MMVPSETECVSQPPQAPALGTTVLDLMYALRHVIVPQLILHDNWGTSYIA